MSEIIYTTKQAAELLNVTQRTVQLWADSGILSVGKTPGGHRRIKSESVHKLLASMDQSVVHHTPPTGTDELYERETVLLVDDEPDILDLISDHITSWKLPINIIKVNDGYEGLVALGHHKPKVLVTDLRMPGMDGYHMLKIIKASAVLDQLKICVVTGYDDVELQDKNIFDDNLEVFKKPIDFDLLKAFIVKSLEVSA